MNPIYDAVARTPLLGDIAAARGLEVAPLLAVHSLTRHAAIASELAGQMFSLSWELLPLIDLAYLLRAEIQGLMMARQTEYAGRGLTRNEQSNVRTRTLTAVQLQLVELVVDDPALLADTERLRNVLLGLVHAGYGTWGEDWLSDRRRTNGTVAPGAELDEYGQALVTAVVAKRWGAWVNKAHRLLGSGVWGVSDEDVVQHALTHVVAQDVVWTEDSFTKAVTGQLKKSAAVLRAGNWRRPEEIVEGQGAGAGEPLVADNPDSVVTRLAIRALLRRAAEHAWEDSTIVNSPVNRAALKGFSDVLNTFEAGGRDPRELDLLGERSELVRRMGEAVLAAEATRSAAEAERRARRVLDALARIVSDLAIEEGDRHGCTNSGVWMHGPAKHDPRAGEHR